jgi:uncharacterized membrane protein YphA (DoxX/SURF4 family)
MLLRITASGLLMTVACENLSRGDTSVLSVSAIVLAIFLMLGLFTRAASCLAAVLIVALSLLVHQQSLAASAAALAVCVSLALLGAGAYSIDAQLFGQRRVVWPRPQNAPTQN